MTDLRAMVKPLEWDDSEWDQREGSEESALSPFGRYYVKPGALFWGPGIVVSTGYAHIAAAKEEAEKDYARRILATLDPAAFERAVAEAVERERDRCARICEGEAWADRYIHWPAFHMPDACSGKEGDLALLAWAFAAAIRKGDTP